MVSPSGVGSLNGVTWLPGFAKQVNISKLPCQISPKLTSEPPLFGYVDVLPKQRVGLVQIQKVMMQVSELAARAAPSSMPERWMHATYCL